jgi:regulator of replication initiation timing
MDAWCKISPCKCRDGINALIAERDRLFQKLGAMTVERDKLKAENEGLRRLRELDAEEYAYLTEIEAERDSLRDALATLRQDGDMLK